MQKIVPFLWFNTEAEEAANFYISVFKDGEIKSIARNTEAGPGPAGSAMVVPFRLAGQDYLALNGGPMFRFNEAISLVINCETQEEVDHFWEQLSAGGEKRQCGWLKDKYGLFWQVVPTILGKLMSGSDKEQSKRVMQAMMQMEKLDIAALQRAYDGTAA